MELSNQGGAASQGFGCVVAVRERHIRAGGRTEGESKQTSGEEGQKEEQLERSKAVGQQHDRGLLRYSKSVQREELKTEKYSCAVSFKNSKHNRMESDSCDDSQSDSGVSADFSPCSTLEGNTNISTGTPATVPKETPIEREIRRAIEREHSLRRSRGLPNLPTSPEYVDIPLRKTVLCQSLTTKSERNQGKDRQFAGKKMQQEIHEEARREQDLVKLGKVPGFYDKGTVRQLKERKQVFEAFQKPSDSGLTVSTKSKTTSWSSASDVSTLENQEDISSQTSTIGSSYVERRQSVDLLSPIESPSLTTGGGSTISTPRGPGFSEGAGRQVIILENNLSVPAQRFYHAKREAEPVTTVDSGSPKISPYGTEGHGGIRKEEKEEEEEEEVVPKENPFFKLRSSTNLIKVEQDIREAQEREKELRKQRISLYGGTGGAKGGERRGGGGGGGGGRPVSIERKSPTFSSSSLNGLSAPDSPGSSPRFGTGSSAAHQSVGKLGMWPPAQAEEERTTQREVLWSPRTPRQKNPLVQRWESGLVNGHNDDDD
ncbi:mitotic interactor and substrate of PLK1 [Toxotes jaculatrix]|uniref:mitotic interactor and substrate of PLK1 n=1 Tax=Toxotes jaculatrix TaxID=941984 RepID=UPI001B3B189E|nr:mitotic interactor and substrate of PLK1 [Toxotes jaculatrix]